MTYILVKVPCECITANIARGCGREPIKHEAQLSALFARDHAPSAIFAVMHGRERYFKWFIVAEFLALAALNDSKWALPCNSTSGAVIPYNYRSNSRQNMILDYNENSTAQYMYKQAVILAYTTTTREVQDACSTNILVFQY